MAEKGPLIGKGRTADVFVWKDDHVLKLYLEAVSPESIEYEMCCMQTVHNAGLPVPAVDGIVEVEGRQGIIFERVEGPTMVEYMLSRPWRLISCARLLAELHAEMHSHNAPELSSRRAGLMIGIRDWAGLTARTRDAVLEVLEELPDGEVLLHGDFHPANVIINSHGPVIIDWPDGARGHPLADIARTWLLLCLSVLPQHMKAQWLIRTIRGVFYAVYLRRYRQLHAFSKQELAAWQLSIAAARLEENIPEERQRLVAFIEAALRRRG